MPPISNFAVKDTYNYLDGFGSYHQSEAFPGASPLVNNSPQKPPYGLRTERISSSSFTAPRDQNLQTWMYRTSSSGSHSEFVPCEFDDPSQIPKHWTPNSYMWLNFDVGTDRDWTSQKLLGRN